jgi:ribonuclease HI
MAGNIGPNSTNNTAEYMALITSLYLFRALELKSYSIKVFADSELVVKQMNGQYKAKTDHIKILHPIALSLFKEIGNISISHIYREENTEADALATLGKKKKSNSITIYH